MTNLILMVIVAFGGFMIGKSHEEQTAKIDRCQQLKMELDHYLPEYGPRTHELVAYLYSEYLDSECMKVLGDRKIMGPNRGRF